jgi:hypothetical protein
MRRFLLAFSVDVFITIILCWIYLSTSDIVDIVELSFCTIFGTILFLVFFIEEYTAKKRKKVSGEIKIFIAKFIFLMCFCGAIVAVVRNINNINKVIPYFILLKGNVELMIINIITKKKSKDV